MIIGSLPPYWLVLLLGGELGDELVLGHGGAEHAPSALGRRLVRLHGGGACAVLQGDDVEPLFAGSSETIQLVYAFK